MCKDQTLRNLKHGLINPIKVIIRLHSNVDLSKGLFRMMARAEPKIY